MTSNAEHPDPDDLPEDVDDPTDLDEPETPVTTGPAANSQDESQDPEVPA